jgi:UDP-N-acetyl-D-glucosamine dehydrogenase
MTRSLQERIESKEAVVGIVGLGYVGLPLALTFGRAGLRVVGFDVDPKKIEALEAGRSYLEHIPADRVAELMKSGRFAATVDFARAAECDALLLCVPTPLTRHREPDMTYVEGTGRALAPHLKAGQLVILESTTYPGTTDELLRHHLEMGSGLTAGVDFHLAYSPEREDPGNPSFDTQRIPKVVGGLTEACQEAALALYGAALDALVPVSSMRVAEMTKLFENVFRSVNIALVNELKMLCERMDIDVWEVIEAASTKPFGFMPFFPGPGLGGHCIPLDPFYLTWKAREYELSTRFIELAGEINTYMPRYVVERTAEALNTYGKALNGSQVLILGVAYKKDVDDVRESPAMKIIELLQDRGASVAYHDPHVAKIPPMRKHDLDLSSVPLSDEALRESDAVVIVTDHSKVDYRRVVDLAPLVVDTRGATRGLDAPAVKIVTA